jgi:hypothetical protein
LVEVPVPKQRHLRAAEHLADDTVVARGGEFHPGLLRSDAERYCSIYGSFGFSVLAVRGIGLDELAQQVPLVRFEVLTIVEAGALRAAGCRLEPTGRNPRHFTVAFDGLEQGIRALLACERRSWVNPYHDH